MKELPAWIIFGVAAVICLLWIFSGVRDDLREDSVFHGITKERTALAKARGTTLRLGVAGTWERHPALLRGIKAAAERLNSENGLLGRTIELDVADDHGTVDGALGVAQAFASRPEVPVVIGHTDPVLNNAVAQNYEFYHVLLFSPNAELGGAAGAAYDLQFSNGLQPRQLGTALLDLIKARGWGRVGLIYTDSPFHQQRARLFESMAGQRLVEVPFTYAYASPDPEVRSEIRRWKRELGLDAIVLTATPQDTAEILAASRGTGIPIPLVSTAQMPKDHTFRDSGETVWCLQPYALPQGHPELVELESVLGYETVMLLSAAAQKAGSLLPTDLAEALRSLKPQPPLASTLRFEEHGAALKLEPVFIRQ